MSTWSEWVDQLYIRFYSKYYNTRTATSERTKVLIMIINTLMNHIHTLERNKKKISIMTDLMMMTYVVFFLLSTEWIRLIFLTNRFIHNKVLSIKQWYHILFPSFRIFFYSTFKMKKKIAQADTIRIVNVFPSIARDDY